jgi:ubiquinone/menaquinone biosynthesis C-methylase UbiE
MIKRNNHAKKYITKLLKEVGIKKGDIVFDCCCGEGNYTLPAADIVERDGLVYALEMNKDKINILKKKSRFKNLNNIIIIEKEFEDLLPLEDQSIDIALLYDIFWYFSIENIKLQLLINEIYRILKDNGLISIYPEHVDKDKLKQIIINNNFNLEKEIYTFLIHDNNIQKGCVWDFKKSR